MILLILFFFQIGWTVRDKWAVLVAGSNGYYNYRHQADISHAYQILTTKGSFKQENIILMMYDDVAHDSANPTPETLINKPGGDNVYPGKDAVDYSGKDCTADNLLGVLNGTAKGKILNSNAESDVFFYFTDHGAPGLVAMPVGEPLYADDLLRTFQWMHDNQKFRQMVVYIEACESGSMLENMTTTIDIFGTTAARNNESSYATYWSDKYQTYLGDEYSVDWMEDSEEYWSADMETLLTQYLHVKKRVVHSHPQIYGNDKIALEKVREFQDAEEESPIKRRNLDNPQSQRILFSDTHDVVLNTLKNRAMLAKDPLDFLEQRKLIEEESASRLKFDTIVEAIVRALIPHPHVAETYLNSVVIDTIDFECLKTIYPHFESACMPWTSYGMRYVSTLIALCEETKLDDLKYKTTVICNAYFDE